MTVWIATTTDTFTIGPETIGVVIGEEVPECSDETLRTLIAGGHVRELADDEILEVQLDDGTWVEDDS